MEIGLFSIPGLKAHEFSNDAEWINVNNNIKLSDLKNRIVILDFWSYCCINCIHMIPILERIQDKYKNEKVVIIGVHSPKFKTEKNRDNVYEAVQRYKIKHPVILDKNMKIWKSYGVNAWPTFVIINPTGKIIAKFSGEISYKNFENGLEQIIKKYDNTFSKKMFCPEFKNFQNKSILRYPSKIDINKKTQQIVISDSGNNRVLILDKNGKILHSFGNKNQNLFNMPQGVCWVNKKEIMVADTGNNVIKKINLEDKKVSLEIGNGEFGRLFKTNQENIAKDAKLNSPWDICIYNKELLITMSGSHQILKYDMVDTVSHFAGNGIEDLEDDSLDRCCFAQPSGITVFKNKIYVADSESSSIRTLSKKNNFTSTIAGIGLFVFGDKTGELSETLLQHPMGLCEAKNGLYISDTFNNSIKYIDLKKYKSIPIISQNEKSICNINDKQCDTLGLFEPNGIKYSKNLLYICDTNNHLIRTFDIKKNILKTFKIKN
ncbi:MAG: redoxin domain-containing protein [Candidatus Micrarchaeaceae archaeon]